MSNTRTPQDRRPSLAKKHTNKTTSRRDAELDEGVSIKFGERIYTVRAGDLTSLDTMALRRETGYSFMGLMRAAQTDMDIDIIASLVWLARRIEGERTLDFASVADEIGYDADFDLVEPEEPEGDDPEASGAA